MLFATLILALDVLKPAAALPSFDCAKASGPVEQLICSDGALARQDAELSTLYAEALRARDHSAQQATQRAWLETRDACAQAADPRGCLNREYQHRIVTLKINAGQMPVFAAVQYVCRGHETTPVAVAFYRTDPPAALLTYLDHSVVLFVAESGSGARYTAANVELWEHQGAATFKWHGEEMACTQRTP